LKRTKSIVSKLFRIRLVRVGGGYLSIDEFLDTYTPLELEKIERKNPLKQFSEKVAVQKTLLGREVRETSPVRSPTRSSPTRKSLKKSQTSEKA
jgi:hypothetical protein